MRVRQSFATKLCVLAYKSTVNSGKSSEQVNKVDFRVLLLLLLLASVFWAQNGQH